MDKLSRLVKGFEGFHRIVRQRPTPLAVPYICPAGFWTIGYGILCAPNHPPITLERGEEMLARVLPAYVGHALRLSPHLTGDRLVAISDFIFNLGPARYAGSTLRKRVNDEDWSDARTEIRRWVFGGGKKLPGLILRREAEAQLL
jgi:lysozyme